MSSKHSAVRALLNVLASKVKECRDTLSAQAIGNALYGLCGVSSTEGDGDGDGDNDGVSGGKAILERVMEELDR
jgi:hypothetical protein